MHSNIIGFNPLLAELPASPTRTFRKELEHYLQRYPDTEQLDIYLHDLNGQLRGKRLPKPGGLSCLLISAAGGKRAGARPLPPAPARAIPNATPSCC